MTQSTKIKVPSFIDDPIADRCITPLPTGIFHDQLVIEDETLTYKSSKLSSKPNKKFKLGDESKLLLLKKEVSCVTEDLKLDPYASTGTEFVLYIIDYSGVTHELIPRFLVSLGQKQWDNFLNELSKYTGLSVEEVNESTNKNNLIEKNAITNGST